MLYRADRLSTVHIALRTGMNEILWRTPYPVKYSLGSSLRKFRMPYRLLGPGDVAIQVGAPWDLLKAGRSRAWHFSGFVGDAGRVIVLEPDSANVRELRAYSLAHGVRNIEVIEQGAWSHEATLQFLSSPDNPAANLVQEKADPLRQDLDRFDITQVSVVPLSKVLAQSNLDRVRLLSITTNGSEMEILEGVGNYWEKIDYVSIINAPRFGRYLEDQGFEEIAPDDRGATFAGRSST